MPILASPNGFKISQRSFSFGLKLHSLNYTLRRCGNHSKNFPGKPPKPSKMHPKTPPNWSPRDFQPQALSLNYPHAQNLTFLIEFLFQKRSKIDLKGCWNPLVLALDRHHFESLIFVTALQRNAHFCISRPSQNSSKFIFNGYKAALPKSYPKKMPKPLQKTSKRLPKLSKFMPKRPPN